MMGKITHAAGCRGVRELHIKYRRDKAKALVRDIIVNDFKQQADDAVISDVAAKMLKALPKTGGDHG